MAHQPVVHWQARVSGRVTLGRDREVRVARVIAYDAPERERRVSAQSNVAVSVGELRKTEMGCRPGNRHSSAGCLVIPEEDKLDARYVVRQRLFDLPPEVPREHHASLTAEDVLDASHCRG